MDFPDTAFLVVAMLVMALIVLAVLGGAGALDHRFFSDAIASRTGDAVWTAWKIASWRSVALACFAAARSRGRAPPAEETRSP